MQNSPLYLSTFGVRAEDRAHRIQSLVHASLDIVDERGQCCMLICERYFCEAAFQRKAGVS